ncbi:PREDICTED: uncharacterized protein LOC108371410 [Rhagoletis zephyria]|uniref:uncharacterized protein LOC108371410 n=1 Tax=Rhagoletis zephyria TaxID=28612 RepID=UPI0008116397|nr:PREDICTED: uncharacterized protein LOC108371410 [Rhagoletis zephyria]XP_036340527.1 protein ALP1-like [Rhagoletis pomonella]
MWSDVLFLEREINGFFVTTFKTLKYATPQKFRTATRMRPVVFDVLFNLLKEQLQKHSIRPSIPAECRLFLTLIYLAHGPRRQYLSLSFKMSVETVRRIVLETSEIIWSVIIWNTLSPFNVSLPNVTEWEMIAADFKYMWDLPNCVGAIDQIHIPITCPAHSGSNFYNCKGVYSIVLLGACDANYVFTAVDVGAYGSQSDGGVLSHSYFGQRMYRNLLGLPSYKILRNSDIELPHYFVGDATFSLNPCLMKPFPGVLLEEPREYFNKRLSRKEYA